MLFKINLNYKKSAKACKEMPYIYIFCKFQHFKGDIERDDRKNGQAPKNREIVYKRGHLFIWTWSF